MDVVAISRLDVCLVNLDPTIGTEINKKRPCLVISPDEMNHGYIKTIIIAPMTTTIRKNFPTRIELVFGGKHGQIALDQMRAIDRVRIIKKLGKISIETQKETLRLLQEIFAEG